MCAAGAPVGVRTCPHQVLVATLTLSQPGGADYAHPIHWGPWLAKIRRGGPVQGIEL